MVLYLLASLIGLFKHFWFLVYYHVFCMCFLLLIFKIDSLKGVQKLILLFYFVRKNQLFELIYFEVRWLLHWCIGCSLVYPLMGLLRGCPTHGCIGSTRIHWHRLVHQPINLTETKSKTEPTAYKGREGWNLQLWNFKTIWMKSQLREWTTTYRP